MKKISGFLAAIMIFMTLFTNLSFAADLKFSDVNDTTQYRDAILSLTAIGLIKGYEDGTFRPLGNITRAEFTVMVTRALGLDGVQVAGDIFTDVGEHYAKYNIRTAYDLGIISGMGDGTFQPDSQVTYEQAVKMIVSMLGYSPNAEALGGYPNGYMAAGAELGITKNVTIASDAPAPRSVIAQILNAALTVNTQSTLIGPDGQKTYSLSEETLLYNKLKIKKIKGTLIGVHDSVTEECTTTLLSNEMCIISKNEEYIIDYTSYIQGKAEVAQYLGYTLTVYIKDSEMGELPILVGMDRETTKNNIVEFESTKIESYKNGQIKYEKLNGSNDLLRIKFDDVSVIYNGKIVKQDTVITLDDEDYSLSQALTQWLSPDSSNFIYGTVKATDAGADGTIDILMIYDYEVLVANKAPTISDYRITDKLISGKYLILEPDIQDYSYTIVKKGLEIPITSIAANDVVLYAKSLDGELYYVHVTSNSVKGNITAYDDEEGVITIDGKKYSLTSNCLAYMDGKTAINVGLSGTFYLDRFDNVIFCSITAASNNSKYAYLVNVSQSGDGETGYATLFAPSVKNVVKAYKLKTKVRLEGKTNLNHEQIISNLSRTALNNNADIDIKDEVYAKKADSVFANPTSQIVKIEVSSDEVSSITTLSDEEGINEDATKMVRYQPLSKIKYSSVGNFSNEFFINSSTTILYIPGDRTDRDEYMKTTASSMFKVNESYWVEPYDVNPSKTAGLLIVYGNNTKSEITKDTVLSIVGKKPGISVVNDENVSQLSVYMSSSTMVTKTADDDKEFADVSVGDVIQFGLTNKNYITNNNVIFKIDDILDVLDSDTFDWTDDKFEYKFENSDGEIEMDASTDTVYSRSFIANVVEVSNDDDSEEKYIRVTQDGFDDDGNIIEGNDERFEIPKTLKIIKYDSSKSSSDKMSTTASGTTTALTIDDLKDAKYNGTDCSKVLLYTMKGKIKFIVIYE